MKKEIIFYQKENWDIPIKNYFDELKINNGHLLAKIISKIELLSKDLLWIDDIKYLKEKIFELRVKKWSNISRIFYFTFIDDNIVLLDWITKKEQKLRKWIFDKMILYKNDYIKRQNIKINVWL